MTQRIRDIMTTAPRVIDVDTTVEEAARVMAGDDIGDVLVVRDGELCGILTDRDVTIRVIAEGRDPKTTRAGDVASRELVTLAPEDRVDDAVRLMRERAVRRIPVVEEGKPVGIVSIGDLAIDLDRDSALADVSAAPANR